MAGLYHIYKNVSFEIDNSTFDHYFQPCVQNHSVLCEIDNCYYKK